MAAEPIDLRNIGQVCVVVRDLEQAMEQYWTQLGIGPWVIYTYGPPLVKDMTYRGKRQDHRMRLAMARPGQLVYELIQPLEGPNIYEDFLSQRGEGLHHLGIYVSDLAAGIEQMKQKGFDVIQSGRGFGVRGDGAYAYFDTERSLGMVFELIERPAERIPPEATYPSA